MSVRRTGRPAVWAASGLPPIATRRFPKTVKRTRIPTIAVSPKAMSTPGCRPPMSCFVPKARIAGSKISVSRPSAIISARPRPAMNNPSVATIGWIPTTPTSTPLNVPASIPTSSAATMAIVGPWSRVAASVAAASAIVAPTERSMPAVATTIAMPRATITTGVTWTSCSRTLFNVAKFGVNSRLKAITTPSAAYTPCVRRLICERQCPATAAAVAVTGAPCTRASDEAPAEEWPATACVAGERSEPSCVGLLGLGGRAHQLHDRVLVDLVATEFANHGAAIEHDHPVEPSTTSSSSDEMSTIPRP